MKKVISALLLLVFLLCFFVGCKGTGNYYSVTVTGFQDSLINPLRSRYKAGEVVEIRAYPVTDVSLCVFVNGERIGMTHFDSDYWGFEFEMPEENVTVHLTFDQFYGKEDYSFAELHPLRFLNSETVKVSLRTTNNLDRYSLIETRYSTLKADIDNFRAIVDQQLKRADNNAASNTEYEYEYSFYYNTDSYTERTDVLWFNDSFFTWNDFSTWQAFCFEDENYALPTIDDPELITYSFKYLGISSDVKRYDDENFSIDYFNIGQVEFIPYDGAALEVDPLFYLDSGYGTINLLSSTVFELNGEYYEIVSGAEYWAYDYFKLKEKK